MDNVKEIYLYIFSSKGKIDIICLGTKFVSEYLLKNN